MYPSHTADKDVILCVALVRVQCCCLLYSINYASFSTSEPLFRFTPIIQNCQYHYHQPYWHHYHFTTVWGPHSYLSLGILLSTGATLSRFYLFLECGLLLYPFPAFIWWKLDQLCIKKKQHTCLKWTKLLSWCVFGFPAKKMKADTKLTVVMCCQIFDRKSETPSSSDFRQQSMPWQSCRQVQEFLRRKQTF